MKAKKLKVGIVGLGRIAIAHAAEIAKYPDKFQWVAAADNDPDRLVNAVPSQLADTKKYDSLEAMLKHPGLDMVTIATRHPDHVPMALKVLEADKIALVEKPIATSTDELKVLLAAGAKHPNKLFFHHNRRFEPQFMKIKELCDSGLIGEVQYIKIYRSVGYCRRNDWMTMPEFYGGLLTNWGPHMIDQALQLLDSPVIDIWADVRHVISIGVGDDNFKIILKAANGRLADVEVSGSNAMPGREMEIVGSRGTLVSENGKVIGRYLEPSLKLAKQKPDPENPPKAYGNFEDKLSFITSEFQIPGHEMSIFWSYLYDTAVNGKPFPITNEQSYEVVRVTEEAFRKSGFAAIKKFQSKVL